MADTADKIRSYSREKYVLPARKGRYRRFSVRAGDIVRDLKLTGRAVCSALNSREFLRNNSLELVRRSGPKSGKSTAVIYTYEFVDAPGSLEPASQGAWSQLRGCLKEVFANLGGGEAYLRRERASRETI